MYAVVGENRKDGHGAHAATRISEAVLQGPESGLGQQSN